MPKRIVIAAVALLILAAAGTAIGVLAWQPSGSSAASSYSFPVPLRVRRAIAHHYPQLAYLPTRLPRGLQYKSYDGVRGFDFNMWFSKPGGAGDELEYTVVAAACAAQGPAMQSFSANGVNVSWSGTYTDQHAWRCITHDGTSVVVQASRSVEGDANPGGPGITAKERRHALVLAKVVAYAEPIR